MIMPSKNKTSLIKCGKTAAILIGVSILSLIITNILNLEVNISENVKLLLMPVLCIPVAIIVLISEYKISLWGLIPRKPNNIKSMILFILCSELVLMSIAFILGLLFPNSDSPVMGENMALYCFAVCVIGPVSEELLYRGVLCNEYDQFNTIIVAILFALMHFSIVNFVFYFLFSLICTRAYRKYETILAPILMHSFSNLIMFILMTSKF